MGTDRNQTGPHSRELAAKLKASDPQVQQYAAALKAENLKLQKQIAKLEAQNVSAHNRIAVLEKQKDIKHVPPLTNEQRNELVTSFEKKLARLGYVKASSRETA